MRFTVSIDPDLIEQAKRISGAKTKKEAIELALKELVRKHRLREAASHAGKVDMAITKEDLEKLRAEG
ncbi:MAG: type II toxin-antitoxin system VapB family antitoxin [Actinomycetota bacterium]